MCSYCGTECGSPSQEFNPVVNLQVECETCGVTVNQNEHNAHEGLCDSCFQAESEAWQYTPEMIPVYRPAK